MRTAHNVRTVFLMAVGLVLLTLLYWYFEPWSLLTRPLRRTMSSRGVAILKGAARVEVFRVSPLESTAHSGNEIGGYPITARGKEQGPGFAARLAAVLLNDGVTQNEKKCGLEPGVAFRAWKNQNAVEILICFKCDVLWPHVVGEQTENPTHEWQDFDPVRADLVGLAKEAFLDDDEIQNLKLVRSDGGGH